MYLSVCTQHHTSPTTPTTPQQLRDRPDFQQLKAFDAFGAAKKMPGQQPAQGQAWWQAWVKQVSDCGLVAVVTKTGQRGSYQVLELTPQGASDVCNVIVANCSLYRPR